VVLDDAQFTALAITFYAIYRQLRTQQLWMGADAYHKSLIQTKPGFTRFWSEFHTSFDEPFHSYIMQEFIKKTSSNN
jgi:hypothetical protein